MKITQLFKDRRQTVAIVTTAAAIAAFFVSWSLVLSPQAAKLSELKRMRQIESEKSSMLSKIQLYEGRIKEQKPLFSTSSEPSWLVDTVSSMASETGVIIEGIAPDQSQVSGEFMTVTLTFDARGDYHSLGRLLGRIESHPVYIQVSSLKAEQREVDSKPAADGMIHMKISLSVLYPVKGILK